MSGLEIHLASRSARRFEWLKAEFEGKYGSLSAEGLQSKEPEARFGLTVKEQVSEILSFKLEAAIFESNLGIQSGVPSAEIIIVADTLVGDPDDPNISLGKPSDKVEAAAMLIRLRGRRHNVWSGTAIIYREGSQWRSESFVENATVEFEDYTPEILQDLIESESWKGKAGGYDMAGQMRQHCRLIIGEEVCVLGFAPLAIKRLEQLLTQNRRK
ncbi:MAG: Maf family protein [Euryarchaeota archaeon]|nr:Maf family protein [Euryarchaeota archaeon]